MTTRFPLALQGNASAIASSLSLVFVVILNAVKDLLLLFPFRCFPSSSARPNHPTVVALGALSPFVVIPTGRSDERSLFVSRNRQNRPTSVIGSSLSSLFAVILNAVKDLLLLFPFHCFPSSSTRPNHPAVVDLGALSLFVVIPTERSGEGSLFVSRNRQNRPASAIVSPLSYLFAVILNAVKDLLLLFPFRCFPSSSARPNHPAVVALGTLSPFVVIPTERSDEGSLFVPPILLRATL